VSTAAAGGKKGDAHAPAKIAPGKRTSNSNGVFKEMKKMEGKSAGGGSGKGEARRAGVVRSGCLHRLAGRLLTLPLREGDGLAGRGSCWQGRVSHGRWRRQHRAAGCRQLARRRRRRKRPRRENDRLCSPPAQRLQPSLLHDKPPAFLCHRPVEPMSRSWLGRCVHTCPVFDRCSGRWLTVATPVSHAEENTLTDCDLSDGQYVTDSVGCSFGAAAVIAALRRCSAVDVQQRQRACR
jgi:hypothetical protein